MAACLKHARSFSGFRYKTCLFLQCQVTFTNAIWTYYTKCNIINRLEVALSSFRLCNVCFVLLTQLTETVFDEGRTSLSSASAAAPALSVSVSVEVELNKATSRIGCKFQYPFIRCYVHHYFSVRWACFQSDTCAGLVVNFNICLSGVMPNTILVWDELAVNQMRACVCVCVCVCVCAGGPCSFTQ